MNHFEAESLLVQRLRTALPDIPVYTPFAADVVESQQGEMSLSVIYWGETLADATANFERIKIDQEWLVVLGVRNARAQLHDTAPVRQKAGEQVQPLLSALCGHRLSDRHGPLELVRIERAGYTAGFQYYPFLFSTRFTTRTL